jgi:cytoskeletal protein CcmA (bactofilin family)
MFGKDPKSSRREGKGLRPARGLSGDQTSLGRGVRLKGTLEGSGEVRLEGHVEGQLRVQGRVLVAAGGELRGDIEGHEVVLEGAVHGEVHARERLVLAASGLLMGGIVSPRLVIEEGGRFQGRCRMTRGETRHEAEPAGPPKGEGDPRQAEPTTLHKVPAKG